MNPLHGGWYYFWSGIGNDLPIWLFGIIPILCVWYRKHRCFRCRSIITHIDPEHHHPACRKHHSHAHKLNGNRDPERL